MSTREWGVGYDEGYQKGWNDAMDQKPAEALAQPQHDTMQRLSALVRAQQITIDKLEAQIEQEPVACRYGDNGYACCEGGPCAAEEHNDKTDWQERGMVAEAALAKLLDEKDEPVEWGVDWGKDGNSVSIIKRFADGNIEVLAWEYAPSPPQRKPLSDEQIGEIGRKYEKFDNQGNEFFARWGFARAIEAAHGIKE